MGKTFIAVGAILVAVGVFWELFGGKLSLGRLPGDIHIQKESFQFSFPIVTCLLISAVLSGIAYLVQYFRR